MARVFVVMGVMLSSCVVQDLDVLGGSPPGDPSTAQDPDGPLGRDNGSSDGGTAPADSGQAPRDGGLGPLEPMVLYRFEEGAGDRVLDSSGTGRLIHATVRDPDRVTWITGGLRIDQPTILTSAEALTEFVEACRRSHAFSVEAWVVPGETTVVGTRRIVSLSVGPTRTNFILGQGGLPTGSPTDAFLLRVRTENTDGNGLPMLATGPGTALPTLTHLVAVRASNGVETIYVDGNSAVTRTAAGDLSIWEAGFRIALGNEHEARDDSRAWLGELHHVALYAQALTADQVRSRFQVGPNP